MYRLNLDELLSLRSCQREFQIADSYDCWGKIARVILGDSYIATPGSSYSGWCQMNPLAATLFSEIYAAVGQAGWHNCMELNDSGEHKQALMNAVHLMCAAGLAELERE